MSRSIPYRDGRHHTTQDFAALIQREREVQVSGIAEEAGIVTMLSPAEPSLPDTPLHYTILRQEEGNRLLALLPPERWHPLRSVARAAL
ncbi:MAG TPA: hypothetical protein VJN92_05500 [Candidatus Acidoferrum sp.]|nr:hypothetical protein [Candidatus Acidoferrum sp.]